MDPGRTQEGRQEHAAQAWNARTQCVTIGCAVTAQPEVGLCAGGCLWPELNSPVLSFPPRCGCPPAAGPQLDKGRGWPEPRTAWCYSFPIWLHLHTAGQAAGSYRHSPSPHPGPGAGAGAKPLFTPGEPCLPLRHPQQEAQAAAGPAVPPWQDTCAPGAPAICGLRLGCA